MGIIFNRKDKNEKRKILRSRMTQAEIILWEHLKGKKLKNLKFRRQFSADRYVMDFYCPKIKLAIEVDGDSHNTDEAIDYDLERQTKIEKYGISFLRIRDEDILISIEDVMLKIEIKINEMSLRKT